MHECSVKAVWFLTCLISCLFEPTVNAFKTPKSTAISDYWLTLNTENTAWNPSEADTQESFQLAKCSQTYQVHSFVLIYLFIWVFWGGKPTISEWYWCYAGLDTISLNSLFIYFLKVERGWHVSSVSQIPTPVSRSFDIWSAPSTVRRMG